MASRLRRGPDVVGGSSQCGRKSFEPGASLLASFALVPDCPLTIWHLAGTLDALGKPADAVPLFTWLLRSTTDADPCWESPEWANTLKADCVYRLGVCFQHLERPADAERCFRKYLDLLLGGVNGTYTPENVTRRVRGLHASNGAAVPPRWSAVARSAIPAAEFPARNGHPTINVESLLAD